MINQLASPAVCVIDDEPEDYTPILTALNKLYVSCVHLLGAVDSLPPEPFKQLRLVFLDLHLTTSVGKDAASYAANAFKRVVSQETAPIVVVIWSKYAHDKIGQEDLPPQDQETESQLFQRTLIEAEPKFKDRLVFVEMAKPKPEDRPEDWGGMLKSEIENALAGADAIEALWAWDTIVKGACSRVCSGLTGVAQGSGTDLVAGLKATMQTLAKAQSEGDLTANTAPRHLTTALSDLLSDQLEHDGQIGDLLPHGDWLSQAAAPPLPPSFGQHMNGLLLTADAPAAEGPFPPGMVYNLRGPGDLKPRLGINKDEFFGWFAQEKKGSDSWKKLVDAAVLSSWSFRQYAMLRKTSASVRC